MRKACADCILDLALSDDRVVFVGCDLGTGAMEEMRQRLPSRFFMEGISEQYILGMAAGLAASGCMPFVGSIASFLIRRGFEQVAIDLCLQDLPVRLLGNGGGLSYAHLGPTHLSTEDLAILRTLPNMTLVAPCDSFEAVTLLKQSLDWHGPIYFRLGGPDTRIVALGAELPKIGCGRLLLPPGRILIVSTGTITVEAWAATDLLVRRGIGCGLLHLHTIKPLDARLLTSLGNSVDLLVTVEEHTLTGGLGSALLETLNDASQSFHCPVLRLGLPDRFVSNYGSRQQLLQLYGLDAASIADRTEHFYSGGSLKRRGLHDPPRGL